MRDFAQGHNSKHSMRLCLACRLEAHGAGNSFEDDWIQNHLQGDLAPVTPSQSEQPPKSPAKRRGKQGKGSGKSVNSTLAFGCDKFIAMKAAEER